MNAARYHSGNRTIRIVGALLGLYLATLIAFGYIGQIRLRESLLEQTQLSMEKQATAVAYFLANQSETIRELSASRQIQTFLANRDLGMSMRYGLRASLSAVSRDFKRLLEHKRAHGHAVFSNIAFVEANGHILLESGVTGDRQNYAMQSPRKAGELQITRDAGGLALTVSAPVIYKDKPAGYLAANIDPDTVLRPFLSDPRDPCSVISHCWALTTRPWWWSPTTIARTGANIFGLRQTDC